eukprot:6205590-Pleurochrysis_carterae.AAC.1
MAYPATSLRPTFFDVQPSIQLVRAGGLQGLWTSFLAVARAAPPRSAPPCADTTAQPASRCTPLSHLASDTSECGTLLIEGLELPRLCTAG